MRADQVIKEPVLTEKTNIMRETDTKKYVFRVDPRASKLEVVQAVKELFSVKPIKCNIVNVKGKPKFTRTRSGYRAGMKSPWKKAIVTLEKGDAIDVIDGV
ncbi:MAG: 50S ribosomal protein L23 [Spirochaetia bacterium]|nr:50S ribosomal protein L23 [Spirochaetia bacterium]MCF7953229.1 50S ribosomal protein L23 [Spirochaetales bacterium]